MNSEMLTTTKKVAKLNDKLRDQIFSKPNTSVNFIKDKIMLSKGVSEMPTQQQMYILNRVKNFKKFNIDNDPYGEHDFGSFVDEEDNKIFWKIDYYDNDLKYHSEDKSNPAKTIRVLTIMKASEY